MDPSFFVAQNIEIIIVTGSPLTDAQMQLG